MDDFIYLNKNLPNDSYIYNVNRAGLSTVSSRFHIKRDRFYPYCVLHYVLNGSCWVKVRGKRFVVKKGELFVLNAYQPHEYGTDRKNPLRMSWVEFSGGDSVRLIEAVLSRQSMVIGEPVGGLVNGQILRLLEILKLDSEKNRYEISKRIYSALICMLEQNGDASAGNMAGPAVSYMKSVLEYIENNLDKDLNVSRLAEIICLDPTYFAKQFHSILKITPARYIMERRISKAKEALAGSNIPIGRISDSIGFCSPSHFIKSFKKAEGLTPTEFRKQCMQYLDMHSS